MLLKMTDNSLVEIIKPIKNKYIDLFYTYPADMINDHLDDMVKRMTRELDASARSMKMHNQMK